MTQIHHVIELDHCASTNDECMQLLAAGAESGTCVIAATQSGGRGRRGRHWHSSDRGNLYASIILRLDVAPSALAPISLVAGIAVAEAVGQFSVPAQLKWPNDVVVGPAKLGGILTESAGRANAADKNSSVVLGIGINISNAPSLKSVGQLATSMREQVADQANDCQLPAPRTLLDQIGHALHQPLEDFVHGGVPAIRDRWLGHWRDLGTSAVASVGNQVIRGRLVDLGSGGAVLIERESGDRVAVVAGDVDIDYA